MKFFNLDLHIGVISDIRQHLEELGHELTDWTLSAHAWVLGRERDKIDIINESNWRSIDQDMCDAFYERYRAELGVFDAFVVTHTPCFARLFERWAKPIIVVASTRYEHPFSDNPAKWEDFNAWLSARYNAGQLVPLSNNLYDAAYAEHFTGFAWPTISSFCGYTGMHYTPKEGAGTLYWSRFKTALPNGVVDVETLRPGKWRRRLNRLPLVPKRQGFSWGDIAGYRASIHIPYNVSIMSIFEQYAASIPLFFPTHRLLMELYDGSGENGVLSQLTFNQVLGLPPRSSISSSGAEDPNRFDDHTIVSGWSKLADFYDAQNMKNIQYFDSLSELSNAMSDALVEEVSRSMMAENSIRREGITSKWEAVTMSLNAR